MLAVIVPATWPAHVGCVGMPPGPTAIVYVSVDPASAPVRNPFKSTVPDDRRRRTGPVTVVASLCVSVHVICAGVCNTVIVPTHVPVRLIEGLGTLGVDLSLHPMTTTHSRAVAAMNAFHIFKAPSVQGYPAKSMPVISFRWRRPNEDGEE